MSDRLCLRLKRPEEATTASAVAFTLNEQKVTLTGADPTMTLNDFLRSPEGGNCQDVKRMCAEGGCGACVCMLSYRDVATGEETHVAINSCLRPLVSVDGCVVTTTNGLGNSRTGMHPVQTRVADHWGSQCGMCTPGFVMSMAALLRKDAAPGAASVEEIFDGNICRCTGYRPILSAMKTFATDPAPAASHAPDPSFRPHGCTCDQCEASTSSFAAKTLQLDAPDGPVVVDTPSAPPRVVTPLTIAKNRVSWHRVTTLPALFALFAQDPGAQIVVGDTGRGVFGPTNAVTLIEPMIPTMHSITVDSEGMSFGAAVSLSALIESLEKHQPASPSFLPMAKHLRRVANVPVRNVACWAGNLMLAHKHDNFQSDVATVLMAGNVTVRVATTPTSASDLTMEQFFEEDMTGKVIVSMRVLYRPSVRFHSFKVAVRHVNAHAYVNLGVSGVPAGHTITHPTMVFGGVLKKAARAVKTEAYLDGKDLTLEATLQGALTTVVEEMRPDPGQPNGPYRARLVLALFYQAYLALLPSAAVPPSLVLSAEPYLRPLSGGVQTFHADPSVAPVSSALPKLTARLQASGEAVYTDDLELPRNGLFASFVLSTIASGTLAKVDASLALAQDDVVAFISAEDVPGVNAFCRFDEPIFVAVGKEVQYRGQAIGMVVARTQRAADEAAAGGVVSTYTNERSPVMTIEAAVAAKSFFTPSPPSVVAGDVTSAFAACDHVVEGSTAVPEQYHFHMETQVAEARPGENGSMIITSATQWPAGVQTAVSAALGRPQAKITVNAKRVGGAYGAKIDRCNAVATAVAVASDVLGVPVRCSLPLSTNMEMVGRRRQFCFEFKVGVNNDGTIAAVQAHAYVDTGSSNSCLEGSNAWTMWMWCDNAYSIKNWDVSTTVCKTNKPGGTSARSPGGLPVTFLMENIIEHAAAAVRMDPAVLRRINLYRAGEVTPYKQPLPYCSIRDIWSKLLATSRYEERQSEVAAFNAKNRWVKRGLSMLPIKYGIGWAGAQYSTTVAIMGADGSVLVTHAGVEMGQGINVKVAQVVAYELQVPLSSITVESTTTRNATNTAPTGGSIGSGLCCQGAIYACADLKKRLESYLVKYNWTEAVQAAAAAGIDLEAQGWVNPAAPPNGAPYQYNSYGAVVTEVRVDCLTGVTHVLRVDMLFDNGRSLNPAVDIGQAEGGFVMGLGYFMTEDLKYDPRSGELLTKNTWEYKPPSSQDIPIDFRVSLLANAPNPVGVLSSKASGEPPLVLSCSCHTAIRAAVAAVRADGKMPPNFALAAPATPEAIQSLCGVTPAALQL